jgi:predicted nucleotide-binding protein
MSEGTPPAHPTKDPRAVFVVHGRNDAARDAMFEFLRSIDLKPIEWTRAVELTGSGSPYIGEVLDAAFDHAQAVVVLMTPDEIAYLQPVYAGRDDDPETQPAAQARPNVLFEAGMALGRDARRTVLVELGEVRPFSDVAGRHAVRLTNDPATRQALAKRLETAGCPVDLTGTDWHRAGDFTPPPPPGGGMALGRRVPSAKGRPRIDFDVKYLDRGSRRAGKLQVINRGTETAYDIKLTVPEGVALDLHRADTIAKIPGNGRSVTIDAFSNNRFMGASAEEAFDIHITARTEDGSEHTQDVFIDMNG